MKYRTQILPNVFLTSVQTDKFKTGCFSLNLLRPLCRGEASANALIPSVLLRGSKQYPDIRSISARLDELYGASMGTLIRKKGEVQFVGFFADYLEDELAHEPVFSQMPTCRGDHVPARLEEACSAGAKEARSGTGQHDRIPPQRQRAFPFPSCENHVRDE